MTRELIITNGDMAVAALRRARIGTGPDDVILPWQDVLYEGPVPLTDDLTELSRIRADHLTSRGWATGRGLHAEFRARDAMIAQHEDFDIVTLWFEHDFHDMLQVLQVLDFLAGEERDRDTLRIVHTDKHISRLSDDELRTLATEARPIGSARFNQAAEAWRLWRETDPRQWCTLALRPRLGIKHLWHAVITSTGHVPARGTGLTTPQRYILGKLEQEPLTASQLFERFSDWSDRTGGRYMGDWSFYAILDEMTHAREPLVERVRSDRFDPGNGGAARIAYAKAPLSITDFGRAVLAGRADHAASNDIDIWLGGTHITNDCLWRRDTETHRLLRT